jgi:hypothetical protein
MFFIYNIHLGPLCSSLESAAGGGGITHLPFLPPATPLVGKRFKYWKGLKNKTNYVAIIYPH